MVILIKNLKPKFQTKQSSGDILTRIIKIILTLTAGNTALHGNECKEYSEGNFLRLINLLAEFDHVLQTLLNNKENYTYQVLEPNHTKLINWNFGIKFTRNNL
jgi:hypothetical protein